MNTKILATALIFSFGGHALAGTALVTKVDGSTQLFEEVDDVFQRPPEDGGAVVIRLEDGTQREFFGVSVEHDRES